MAREDEAAESGYNGPTGVVVIGEFLGVKEPEAYDIDGRKGMSAPRIGLRDTDGLTHPVVVSDETLNRFRGLPRGTVQSIAVNVRPPFRQGQPSRLVDRTVPIGGGSESWD